MTNAVWKDRVDTALVRLQKDRWTAPAVRYMEIVDDVAAGRGSAADIARRAGSPDMVEKALGRVTSALLGDEAPPRLDSQHLDPPRLDPPRLDQGGWYESDGGGYRGAPDFAEVWIAARDAQRRLEARQSA